MELKHGDLTNFRKKLNVDRNGHFGQISDIFNIRRTFEIMLLEKKMNIKNSVLDYIRNKQLN